MRPLAHLALALCAACATAPRSERAALDAAPVLALRAADFPAAAALLDGYAATDDDPMLRVGDAALLALEFRRGARVERQLMRLEVVALPIVRTAFGDVQATLRRTTTGTLTTTTNDGEPHSQSYVMHDVTVRVQRFAADGRELASADVTLYEEALRAGWWPDTDPAADETARAMASMITFSMQRLANDERSLRDALFLAVDPPSLWSLATNLGVLVNVRTAVAPPVTFPARLPGSDGAEVRVYRLDLDLNGDPALEADLLIVKPRGGTMLCGGLVGVVARNPDDPERGVVARLLATRRGAAAE
ncbi:MAG: hypothetical protein H6835_04000 [Planctomycetes bacterium]|nr:hypothetical protein [Planctomycetota bacterium]